MEVENEQETIKTKDNEQKMGYLSQLLGLKIKNEELSLFKDMGDLSLFIANIKFSDKKKNEIKDAISDEIKSLENKEINQKYSEPKNKKFSEIINLNGKTTIYHTAEKDELSETMHAFYFCNKSKQIFSDKQAAEYRAMHLSNGYELPLAKALRVIEEDNNSSYSNLKQNNATNENIDNESKLNKKRKANKNINIKKKSCKKKKIEDNNIKNGGDLEEQEAEYCIPKCQYERKCQGEKMIECDNCSNWYHAKCLNLTDEQFQKCGSKDKTWFCPDCSKMDMEALEKIL